MVGGAVDGAAVVGAAVVGAAVVGAAVLVGVPLACLLGSAVAATGSPSSFFGGPLTDPTIPMTRRIAAVNTTRTGQRRSFFFGGSGRVIGAGANSGGYQLPSLASHQPGAGCCWVFMA